MDDFFERGTYLDQHRSMFDTAQEVETAGRDDAVPGGGRARVVVPRRGGRVRYDESPPVAGVRDPLPFFLETKRGYCQHYAGAMALMLRFIGVPARVAAGFTSGSYDTRRRRSGRSRTTTPTPGSRSASRATAGSRSTRRPSAASSRRSTRRTPPAFDAAEAAAISAGSRTSRRSRPAQPRRRDSSSAGGRHRRERRRGGRRSPSAASVLGVLLLVLAVAVAALLVLKEGAGGRAPRPATRASSPARAGATSPDTWPTRAWRCRRARLRGRSAS